VGRKKISGLIQRNGIWHIDKVIRRRRVCESTGTSEIEEAERFLALRMEQLRQVEIYGTRPKRTWHQAVTKHLTETVKVTRRDDEDHLRLLDPFIGALPLEAVHMGTLQPFIEFRKNQKVKKRTINYALQVVRHILNLAASEWMDEHGLTWLAYAPKIKLLKEDDKSEPYPLSWQEQERFFPELPEHLRRMAEFAVNTGLREQVVCLLRWDWEIEEPELNTSVFIIPKDTPGLKNGRAHLLVLNTVARRVVEQQRGIHPERVFTYKGSPIKKMYGAAWRKARSRAGLPQVRVHDLKHTFGKRLRAAGVSFEDRQDLLGHRSVRITTHYSSPERQNLIAAANRVCGNESRKSPALVILKRKSA